MLVAWYPPPAVRHAGLPGAVRTSVRGGGPGASPSP